MQWLIWISGGNINVPSKFAFPLLGKGTHVGLSAAVERGPSQGARSGSTGPTWGAFLKRPQFPTPLLRGVARLPFTARIGRAQFHRARSASKKGTWPHLSPGFPSFHSF